MRSVQDVADFLAENIPGVTSPTSANPRLRGWVTSAEVLEARGVKSRRVLHRDRAAGLFAGLDPVRTSRAYWSVEGVLLRWPPGSLRRARRIRRLLDMLGSRARVRAALDAAGELRKTARTR